MKFDWIERKCFGCNTKPDKDGEICYITIVGGIYQGEVIVFPSKTSGQWISASVKVLNHVHTEMATGRGGTGYDGKTWNVNSAMSFVEKEIAKLLEQLLEPLVGLSLDLNPGRNVRSSLDGQPLVYCDFDY